MVHPRGIVAVHCRGRVKQRRKQILFDIAHLRGVGLHTVNNILNMPGVQLQQF